MLEKQKQDHVMNATVRKKGKVIKAPVVPLLQQSLTQILSLGAIRWHISGGQVPICPFSMVKPEA